MENVLFAILMAFGLLFLLGLYLIFKMEYNRIRIQQEIIELDNIQHALNNRYVKIGWVNDDFAKNQFTIYIKCDNIADYVYKWDMELNLPKTFKGDNVDIKELRKFLEIFKAIRDSMKM